MFELFLENFQEIKKKNANARKIWVHGTFLGNFEKCKKFWTIFEEIFKENFV